ncbi:MAG: alkaline phosphatase [Thermoguttaceae bacterium]|jgi:alkaline phosphatase
MSALYKSRHFLIATLTVLLCVSAVVCVRADEPPKAKNVILFIADGAGFNSEVLGSYYRTGEAWGESYQNFPTILGVSTFAIHRSSNREVKWDPVKEPEMNAGYVPSEFWKDPSGAHWRASNTAVTDSAAAATAINTGVKTNNGRINVDPQDNVLENFAQKNAKAGRSVGVVTTTQISHATPAGVCAHNDNRNAYQEISQEQINDAPINVLMGAGHPEYNNGRKIDKKPEDLQYQFVGGRELWEKVKANDGYKDWNFIDHRSQFAELAAATPDSGQEVPSKVLGIVRTGGGAPPIDGDVDDPQKMIDKYSQETVDAIPSLTEMTLGALNVLSTNDNGFYLMVEGGNIDGANHSNNAANSVLEHTGFAKAIDAAIEWVEKYSSWDETLMIVTADHETGQIWGDGTYVDENNNGRYDSEDTFEGFQKIEASKKGEVPDVQYLSGGHTNALVPFCAKGAGAESAMNFIRGNDAKAAKFWNFSGDYIYNIDVYTIMSTATGIE